MLLRKVITAFWGGGNKSIEWYRVKVLSLLEFDSFCKEKQGSKYINMAEKSSRTENMSLVRIHIASHCWRRIQPQYLQQPILLRPAKLTAPMNVLNPFNSLISWVYVGILNSLFLARFLRELFEGGMDCRTSRFSPTIRLSLWYATLCHWFPVLIFLVFPLWSQRRAPLDFWQLRSSHFLPFPGKFWSCVEWSLCACKGTEVGQTYMELRNVACRTTQRIWSTLQSEDPKY